MKLGLNMIVKNESQRIVRALDSVVQFIDAAVICDTGSTDNTPEIIKDYFAHHHVDLRLVHAPFEDWSQARNEALKAAYESGWADYWLLMDADMELRVLDLPAFKAMLVGPMGGRPAYDMYQRAGALEYQNKRIVKAKAGFYRGVTHEYLDVPSGGCVPNSVAFFLDHADGANRPDKYKRDIALLLKGLEEEPANGRYFYYLAQSYRDAGDYESAIKWYKRRVDFGGWEEERWSAQANLAHCYKNIGNEAEFVKGMLDAYNMRPSRAETLYDLARHYRDGKNTQAAAALFAGEGLKVPRTNDALFVNDFVYRSGLAEEFAITAFYVPHLREKGARVCDRLSLDKTPYPSVREGARMNLYWYTEPLQAHCPSFHTEPIKFTPPQDWVTMNPSITTHNGRPICVVRCVNYRIDEHGRYLIRGLDGTANATNPINTRNFLLNVEDGSVVEIKAPDDLPCEFPLVVGFEDMRLFTHCGELWTSSTVRQIHPDGNCEQVLARIDEGKLVDIKRMLRQPRETEKNWAPIDYAGAQRGQFRFMYRPGVMVDQEGRTVMQADPPFETSTLSGGTQVIWLPSHMCYLAVLHEARLIPGKSIRWYWHRFITYDHTFRVQRISRPFVFEDKVIEFAAGMYHRRRHRTDELVISYGFKDCEAKLATVDLAEVMEFMS